MGRPRPGDENIPAGQHPGNHKTRCLNPVWNNAVGYTAQ